MSTVRLWYKPINAEESTRLAHNSTLSSLDLWDVKLDSKSVHLLATSPYLKKLHLGMCHLTDQMCKVFTANTTLTSLDLRTNSIGSNGANYLAANTTLKKLVLKFNQVGDQGAKALAGNTNLLRLDLWDNSFGEEGARAFIHNTTLTDLNIEYNNISDPVYTSVRSRVDENRRQLILRRTLFIYGMIALSRDVSNPQSTSLWKKLPNDMRKYILHFVCNDLNLVATMKEKLERSEPRNVRKKL